MLPLPMARYFSDNATSYELPVLWTTSCFHSMDQIQMKACSLRRNELFTVTRQVAPLSPIDWLKPNSITLAGSELVRSWFGAGS